MMLKMTVQGRGRHESVPPGHLKLGNALEGQEEAIENILYFRFANSFLGGALAGNALHDRPFDPRALTRLAAVDKLFT